MGKAIMIQGTCSDAGKSLMVSALCRIFAQDGYRVAPFKSQNMALNSAVTADGKEIGRAQFVQAQAAGVEPAADMNPILLKPVTDTVGQVIVCGKAIGNMSAQEYIDCKPNLLRYVKSSLGRLTNDYDIVVIEGAGSPAEVNLRDHDIVNMPVAKLAEAPVLLVADIDRGGVFAYVLGTLSLLNAEERSYIRGIVVNKFRGDISRFADGKAILEKRSGVPVAGIIPYIEDLGIPEEDSVPGLSTQTFTSEDKLRIGVIYLPHISNFTDFDPLAAEDSVELRYIKPPYDLSNLDLIIIPGTKNTLGDLKHLQECGFARQIKAAAASGIPVFGVCGGYQMLGRKIVDKDGVESDLNQMQGLELLDMETEFEGEKVVARTTGTIAYDGSGLFKDCQGLQVTGYEIHMGSSKAMGNRHLIHKADASTDGAVSGNGLVAGTYIHGFFDNSQLRHRFVSNLWQTVSTRDRTPIQSQLSQNISLDEAFNQLAERVRESLDMDLVYHILGMLPEVR